MMQSRTRTSTAIALALVLMPTGVLAEAAGVAALLSQAGYWQGKGRQDLANQAYRQVLAIDPANVAARRGLAGPLPAAPPRVVAPARAVAPVAKPQARPVAPAPVKVAAPASVPVRTVPRSPTVAADPAGDARAAGFRNLDANNLQSAATQFRRALSIHPNDSDALGGLGIVQLRQKNFAAARDLLAKASTRGSGDKWAEALSSAKFYAGLDEAQADFAAGRIDAAQGIAEDLSNSSSPQRGPALQLLASIYQKKGHFAEAAALYQTAAKLDPKTSSASAAGLERQALHAQALQAATSGNDTDAEQLFQRGMVNSPGDPWIRYDYARFLDQRGRRADVNPIILSLSQSSTPDSLYAAALLSSQIGRGAAAAGLIGRVPEDQRTGEMRNFAIGLSADTAIDRSKVLAARGEGTQAVAALRQIAATPGLPMSKQAALADAVFNLGDTAGAAAMAQQALATGSTAAEDYEPVVRVLAQTGQDALAATAAQKAAELSGSSVDGQRTIARINGIQAVSQADRLRQGGQYAEAFDALQTSWQASPGNREILSALARLYQSGGLYPQAAQTFQLVLQQTPNDKGALVGLVDTASAAGDYGLARGALDRAIRIDPADYQTYLAGARMERTRGDDGASVRYLKRARELYTRQNATGGFGATNPFAATAQKANPFGAAAVEPVNPFALGSARSSGRSSAARLALSPVDFTGSRADPGLDPAPVDNYAPGHRSAGVVPYPAAAGSGRYGDTGAVAAITDPVLQSIARDMQDLSTTSAPRADIRTEYRQRSGEVGLSKLKEVGATAELSTGLVGGRVSVKANAVVLDSGQPTGSGLARFGRNPTIEAQAIVDAVASDLVAARSQHASGVAPSVAYEDKLVKVDVGSTPIGFGKTNIAGGVTLTPRLSSAVTSRIWADRRPVTDSVVSYAGARDPVSGTFWGAVMRAGGGASLSYDVSGTGVYADSSYYHYSGSNVRDNHGIQANVGGYAQVLKHGNNALTLGVSANYQDFANNQNFFSFGHGGYFSPQSFVSIAFPIHYSFHKPDGIEVDVNAGPGYQSYDQKAENLYPTDPAAQAALDTLKAADSDVRASYDSISKTGFGVSAGGSVFYPLNPWLKVGGDVTVNTFGDYNEFRASVGIKQVLGGQR